MRGFKWKRNIFESRRKKRMFPTSLFFYVPEKFWNLITKRWTMQQKSLSGQCCFCWFCWFFFRVYIANENFANATKIFFYLCPINDCKGLVWALSVVSYFVIENILKTFQREFFTTNKIVSEQIKLGAALFVDASV